MIQKPELLAPAGDLEKLKMAVLYGADAVYLGGQCFSLRAQATNFSPEEMAEGIAFAHAYGCLLYTSFLSSVHCCHQNGDVIPQTAAGNFDGLAQQKFRHILGVVDIGIF